MNEKILSDGEQKKELKFNRELFNTLHQAYSPFLGKIIFFIALGFLGRGLLLANANIIGYWVDSYCVSSETCKQAPALFQSWTEKNFLALLIAMTGLGFVFTSFFRIGFSRLSARAVSAIYDEVTLRTSRFPMSFFDSTPTGRIVTRFSNDYGQVFRLFGGPLAEFFSIIFDLFMMVLLITLASPFYLIFVVFIAGFNYLIYRLNRDQLRQARRELSASRSPSISHFSETTQGASTIRTFNRQKPFVDRFVSLDSFYIGKKLHTTKRLVLFSLQMNSLTALLFLMTGLSAYYLVQNNYASVGSVGVAFSFIALSGNTVQMFFEWLTQFEEALIGLERLDSYLRKPIEQGARLPSETQFNTNHFIMAPTRFSMPRMKSASLQFNQVSLKYREDLPWVLRNISFEVQAGEKLGLVGRTGSGKSSLIQALYYLYPIQQGEIRINGQAPVLNRQPQNEMGLEEYRSQISFISQDPVLFQGSLRENLDPAQSLSDDQLLQVLTKVGLFDWVQAHPQKLKMRIEEKGKNLSLGERQLLCMARCLLQEAPLIVMDEATSSVDPQSEEIMVHATEEFFKDRTQIIIAHRLSTLEKCDRILWLDQGEIKMIGPAQEVLKKFHESADH